MENSILTHRRTTGVHISIQHWNDWELSETRSTLLMTAGTLFLLYVKNTAFVKMIVNECLGILLEMISQTPYMGIGLWKNSARKSKK